MGRPLGSRNKAKDEAVIGDNSKEHELTPEQRRSLLMQACDAIGSMKADVESITGEMRAVYKAAKADGLPKKDIDFALQLRSMDSEAVLERITRHSQIIEWIHPGVQAELDFGQAAE